MDVKGWVRRLSEEGGAGRCLCNRGGVKWCLREWNREEKCHGVAEHL